MDRSTWPILLLRMILPVMLYECLYYGAAALLRLTPDMMDAGTGVLPVRTLAAAVTVIILGMQYRKETAGYEDPPQRPVAKSLILLILLGVMAGISGNLLINLTGLPEMSESFRETGGRLTDSPLLMQVIGMVIVIPLCEELIYRGFVYRILREELHVFPAALLSSFLFAALHGNPVQGIYAFVLGLILALLYEKYQLVCGVFAVHAAANLTAVILPFVFNNGVGEETAALTGIITAAAAAGILYILIGYRSGRS